MTAAEAAFRAEVDEYCAVRPELLTVRPAGARGRSASGRCPPTAWPS